VKYVTAWGKVLLEKLIVPHIVIKFSVFCQTYLFVTFLTISRHWTLSYAN